MWLAMEFSGAFKKVAYGFFFFVGGLSADLSLW